MIPTQYMFLIKAGLAIAAVSACYYVYTEIKEKGQLEVAYEHERQERQEAEAKANELSKKLYELQEIDKQKDERAEALRKRAADAVRELEGLRSNPADKLWLDTVLPPGVADRVREVFWIAHLL